jgi:MFS transporter, putative metabolite:H+ symporter
LSVSHTNTAFNPKRRLAFWLGVLAVSAGVALHLPMLHYMPGSGLRVMDMGFDPGMVAGMVMIAAGIVLSGYGLYPDTAGRNHRDDVNIEARDGRLTVPHVIMLIVISLALVIDTMKPATIGFVLPGLRRDYGIARETAALLPLFALTGTVVGSILWGVLADVYGRKASILLSTIIFIATSICGAMPSFHWNLAMCFVMGASAGGMMPVAYTLLAEIVPPRQRSAMLVLVGGTGLVGGYLAASATATILEPVYGWRILWLQGFPTGLLLIVLSRFIPESPRFLLLRGEKSAFDRLVARYDLVVRDRPAAIAIEPSTIWDVRFLTLTAAMLLTAMAWSFVNFGLLLWLPTDLQAHGYDAAAASRLIAKSTLIALPTIVLASILYSRWSSKWTLVGAIFLTMVGLLGATLSTSTSIPILRDPTLVLVVLIVGVNGLIAVLLPYAAEIYPESIRGRATGLIAAGSKSGGILVQIGGLAGFIPTFGTAALLLLPPIGVAALLVGWVGQETRGRKLEDITAEELTAAA